CNSANCIRNALQNRRFFVGTVIADHIPRGLRNLKKKGKEMTSKYIRQMGFAVLFAAALVFGAAVDASAQRNSRSRDDRKPQPQRSNDTKRRDDRATQQKRPAQQQPVRQRPAPQSSSRGQVQ